MNYYYLVAGLPDIQPADTKTTALTGIADELNAAFSSADKKLFRLLLYRYDNRNLLDYFKDKDAPFHPLGMITAADWARQTALLEDEEPLNDKRLPAYLREFYTACSLGLDEHLLPEDVLAAAYYEYGMQCRNKFVSAWFEFNLNLNNVLAALMCRKHGFDVKAAVVGNNDVAKSLRTSNARDFGLNDVFDLYDEVVRIAEISDLLEREKRIDALKWNWLEEHTFFDTFSTERVLAFWLKCELLNRWEGLTTEKGKAIFRQLMDEFKKEVTF